MKTHTDAATQRLNYVDWLRVAAVLLLFPFHAGEIFTPNAFYVKDQTVSTAVRFVNSFIYHWHMPLFMFLAGISTHFALRFRSSGEYLLERVKRLLVPLVFGTFVIIPPQAYLRMFGDPVRVWPRGFAGNAPGPGYAENFFRFYPRFFNGIFPHGNFEWGHLWFLAYLFTFSLLALPLFLYLRRPGGARVVERLAGIAEKRHGILLFALPIALFEVALRWRFPGLQNLVADWANFLTFCTIFVYGFIIMADRRFTDAVDRAWGRYLAAGILLDLALVAGHRLAGAGAPTPALYVLAMCCRAAANWLCILGILGLGRKFLNRGGALLRYAREAALPFYVIHQTAVIIAGFYVVQTVLPLPVKYLAITAASFVMTAALYELAVRRVPPLRFLFGMKGRPTAPVRRDRRSEASPAAQVR
ncbi:MAG: acyltransferase family protein [Spirochaetes bacterium]|nr:acyltransferase family protein [Spirochaetota bacterium]